MRCSWVRECGFVSAPTLQSCGFRTLDGLGMAGTPGWMAPEQLQGDQSQQSDLYACGIIAYQLLAGRHPKT